MAEPDFNSEKRDRKQICFGQLKVSSDMLILTAFFSVSSTGTSCSRFLWDFLFSKNMSEQVGEKPLLGGHFLEFLALTFMPRYIKYLRVKTNFKKARNISYL